MLTIIICVTTAYFVKKEEFFFARAFAALTLFALLMDALIVVASVDYLTRT